MTSEEDCDDDSTEDGLEKSGSSSHSTMAPGTTSDGESSKDGHEISRSSGSSSMTPGRAGDDGDESTIGTSAHGSGASGTDREGAGSSSGEKGSGVPSAALPITSVYTATGSQAASMRPTSASSHSGRPISTGKIIL